MKVIEDNYKLFPIQARCKHCGSLIEIENLNDMSQTLYSDYYIWTCPCCNIRNEIIINKKEFVEVEL